MKISAMIIELGSDGFWMMAQTPEDKENLLRTACSAWNIACAELSKRNQLIENYVSEYSRLNSAPPDISANLRDNIKHLIRRKEQLFPDEQVLIANAQIIYEDGEERVEVASRPM